MVVYVVHVVVCGGIGCVCGMCVQFVQVQNPGTHINKVCTVRSEMSKVVTWEYKKWQMELWGQDMNMSLEGWWASRESEMRNGGFWVCGSYEWRQLGNRQKKRESVSSSKKTIVMTVRRLTSPNSWMSKQMFEKWMNISQNTTFSGFF